MGAVKGRAENALRTLPFKAVYNLRPGMMKPQPGQKNLQWYYRALGGLCLLLRALFPNHACSIRAVSRLSSPGYAAAAASQAP